MDGEKVTAEASTGRPQKRGVKKQKTAAGPANVSSKVIVQSIPSNVVNPLDYFNNPKVINQIYVDKLMKLFCVYGRISACDVYLHYLSDSEIFAHITYASRNSAVRAHAAAVNREIKMNGSILTVTMVSEGCTPIDVLNDYCLIVTFSLLRNRDRIHLEAVCKRWKDLAQKSWYNVKEFDCTVYTTDEREGYLRRCGRYLTSLTFPALPNYLSQIQEYCPNVENITANYYYGEYKYQFRHTIEQSTKLNTLAVELSCNTFDGSIVEILPASIEEIKFVSSLWFQFSTGKLIDQDYSRFYNLRKIVINGLIIENSSIGGLENLQNLTHLDINDTGDNFEIFDKIQCLKNLTFLAISHYTISDHSLINIVTNNRSLEHLDISYTRSLTDKSLIAVSALPNLKSLKMALVRNISLLRLNPMRNLELLDCNFCRDIGEADLAKVINSSPSLRNLIIRQCNISWSFIDAIGIATESRENNVTLNVVTSESINLTKHYPLLAILQVPYAGDDSIWSSSSTDFYYEDFETDSDDNFEILESYSESEFADDE